MEAKYGSRHANSSQNLNKSPHFHIRNRGFFYKSIFEKVRIDFVKFSNQFGSEEMKQATNWDFRQSRQWGVNGFSAVLFRKDD